MKYSFYIALLLIMLTSNVYSQLTHECINRINNDSITYSIYYNAFFVPKGGAFPKVTFRLQTDLNNCDSEMVVKYIIKNFDALFIDEGTDWAANIVLLNFFPEDVYFLVGDVTIQEWRHNYKQDCISLWRKILEIEG